MIVITGKKEMVRLENVEQGKVFADKEGNVWLKTEDVESTGELGGVNNSVILRSEYNSPGEVDFCPDNMLVILYPEAELHLGEAK